MIKVISTAQQDIKQFVGKMVFLVCHPEEVESTDEFFVTPDWDALISHLSSLEVDDDSVIRVLYGILASAEFLPENIGSETAYLIAEDPDDSAAILVNSGFPGSDAIEKLALLIDEAIGDEKTTFVLSRKDLTIDHLFVLYGQKVTLGYSAHKDSLDEASLDSRVELYKEISRIKGAIKK